MERAAVLVIEERPDGVFLYRFSADGACVGDTWHMNVDDAKHQAAFEFEGFVGDWADVPEGTEDVAAFCRSLGEFRGRA